METHNYQVLPNNKQQTHLFYKSRTWAQINCKYLSVTEFDFSHMEQKKSSHRRRSKLEAWKSSLHEDTKTMITTGARTDGCLSSFPVLVCEAYPLFNKRKWKIFHIFNPPLFSLSITLSTQISWPLQKKARRQNSLRSVAFDLYRSGAQLQPPTCQAGLNKVWTSWAQRWSPVAEWWGPTENAAFL